MTQVASVSISVIIPTMGRNSLIAAINSAINQTYPAAEIIIVGNLPEKLLAQIKIMKFRKLVFIYEGTGNVSHRRNLGIAASQSDYVAFLDDDDIWYSQKLEFQAKCFPADIVSCRAYFLGWRPGIRPHNLVKNNILRTIYSDGFLRINKYGVYTPTLIVKRSLALKIGFDLKLREYEDLWFLFNLERAGAKFVQIPEVLVQISSSKPLANRMIDIQQYLDWYDKLKLVDIRCARRYIIWIALRNLVYMRKFKLIVELIVVLVRNKDRIEK